LTTTSQPSRGEIWLVNLDPTLGSEFQKTRPALVVSSMALNRLPVRIVVPITTWQPRFANQLNKVFLRATPRNGLDNDSAGDVLQVRCVAVERFIRKVGQLEADLVEEVVAGIVLVIDYR
jgi:mRNA interferase MazF